jgi:hypothetical protein
MSGYGGSTCGALPWYVQHLWYHSRYEEPYFISLTKALQKAGMISIRLVLPCIPCIREMLSDSTCTPSHIGNRVPRHVKYEIDFIDSFSRQSETSLTLLVYLCSITIHHTFPFHMCSTVYIDESIKIDHQNHLSICQSSPCDTPRPPYLTPSKLVSDRMISPQQRLHQQKTIVDPAKLDLQYHVVASCLGRGLLSPPDTLSLPLLPGYPLRVPVLIFTIFQEPQYNQRGFLKWELAACMQAIGLCIGGM